MNNKFLEPPGHKVHIDKIDIPKARSLAQLLVQGVIQYAKFIECRLEGENQTIVFEVEVEVPQLLVHEISSRERIAATFSKSDEIAPEVISLRGDFPKVPHLNLTDQEYPKSLCLYEELYRDLKSRWTAPIFVERIREWFALTAKGNLHQNDQPLEPLIVGHSGHILLPHNLLEKEENVPSRLFVTGIDEKFFVAHSIKHSQNSSLDVIASVHVCQPTTHGIINRRPNSIADLAKILTENGLNLLGELRQKFKGWLEDDSISEKYFSSCLVLIILSPKTRKNGGEVEHTDTFVFATGGSVKEVGIKLDAWEPNPHNGRLGGIFFPDSAKNGQDILLDSLNPCFELTRKLAANLNGYSDPEEVSIAAIGVGALGSQIVMNLARAGFGKWILIDNDRLMPHNLARHELNTHYVGFVKSRALSFEANLIYRDQDLFKDIPADIISPGDHREEVETALNGSDVILDMSASVTVARYLAHDVDSTVRRVTIFLTPTGNDSVLIAEDKCRTLKLDEIEMQYYRAILEEERLKGHFKPPEGRRRYGQSCRDITSTLPQHFVALHAAITGKAFREVSSLDDAHLKIWRADESGNVQHIEIELAPVVKKAIADWTISTDINLISKLSRIREAKLPNETGGVLLGSFDLARRIIYVVDSIPSPPDSREWPTWYVRGCHGLKKKIEGIVGQTDGMLTYIGEWHSHPNGASIKPSNDDRKVFSWLNNIMERDGFPPLMLIVGEKKKIACFVEEIGDFENYLPILEKNDTATINS